MILGSDDSSTSVSCNKDVNLRQTVPDVNKDEYISQTVTDGNKDDNRGR